MSRQWYLEFVNAGPEDEKRLHWLVKSLQNDPYVAKVATEVDDPSYEPPHIIRVIVTFADGHDSPQRTAFQGLDHTNGERRPWVSHRPTIWQRLLRGIGV
jgi:hypothetical protein